MAVWQFLHFFKYVQGPRSSRSSRSSISGPGPLPQEPANDARSLDVGPWLAEEWQTLGFGGGRLTGFVAGPGEVWEQKWKTQWGVPMWVPQN